MAPSRGSYGIWQWWTRAGIFFALAALETARAQQQLPLPSVTRLNLNAGQSASYRVAPAAAQAASKAVTYFVTLDVCAPAAGTDLSILEGQPVLFASNSSSNTAPTRQAPGSAAASWAIGGFANITFIEPVTANVGAWIGVTAPDGSGIWSFELGVSTTAPMHIIDRSPLFAYDDSDQNNALLTGRTYSPAIDGSPATEALIAVTNGAIPIQLSSASCFIRTSSAILPQNQITESLTGRGVVALTAREGATGDTLQRSSAGLIRMQYAVGGLSRGTNYTVWGIEGTGQTTSDNGQGLRLYQPQYFRTKSGNSCRLVYNMAVCPNAAYAVPSPPTLPTSALLALYSAQMQPHLANFNTTLNAFSCGNPSQGMYSYVRTCDQCMTAYTNWLCSVMMPRCDDVPAQQLTAAQLASSSALNADTNTSVGYLDPLSARPFPQIPFSNVAPSLILRTDPSVSRTPLWGTSALANLTQTNSTLAAFQLTPPFPYAEPPPCSSLCYQVAASCPSLISWSCPLVDITLEASYGQLRLLPRDSAQGGDQATSSHGWGRPGDRFGNVFCNALGVDVLLAKRSGAEVRALIKWPVVLIAWTLMYAVH